MIYYLYHLLSTLSALKFLFKNIRKHNRKLRNIVVEVFFFYFTVSITFDKPKYLCSVSHTISLKVSVELRQIMRLIEYISLFYNSRISVLSISYGNYPFLLPIWRKKIVVVFLTLLFHSRSTYRVRSINLYQILSKRRNSLWPSSKNNVFCMRDRKFET